MKTTKRIIFSVFLLLCFLAQSSAAQTSTDTIYLPRISIQSLNGFGPYVIGTKRTNLFIADSLPPNTSKITFRMIDAQGETINSGHTEEGQQIQQSFWQFESDTMDFSLSTRLNVEVVYQGDSVANYYIPYIIEASPIHFEASAGWGPFITNNYNLNDTAWQPVPEQINNFKATTLPPRTDTVKFIIYSADSSIIQQHVVTASGKNLDSAFYNNVRMDKLPVDTRRIDLVALCDGAPPDGIRISKELIIRPQKPKLICKTNDQVLQDSIPHVVEKCNYGQALSIDTNKYVDILNGPGLDKIINQNTSHYAGPYSIDFLNNSFTIEAWYKFNQDALNNENGQMTVLTVDSLWGLMFHCTDLPNRVALQFKSFVGGNGNYLFGSPIDIYPSTWNHIAVTSHTTNGNDYEINVYHNGVSMDVDIDHNNYHYVSTNFDIDDFRKTKHLSIGGKGVTPYNQRVAEAIDEIRIWDYARSEEEINENYTKKVLQTESLLGYWNFNDRRNRLKNISDLSFYNNTGILQNGCMFIPQDNRVDYYPDSITLMSSNLQTSSVAFEFYNRHNKLIFHETVPATDGIATLVYDLSELPHTVNNLVIQEHYPGIDQNGNQSSYPMIIHPYIPMATPKYNWSSFYQSDSENDKIFNEILVSNLPGDVYKVEVGLEKGSEVYDEMTFFENSIPHRYGFKLDGSSSYIQTTKNITIPITGSYSLWFQSTSREGGKIIGFGTTQNGVNSYRNERELFMEKDGSLRFVVNEYTTLYGLHAYNDGEWHFVEVTFGQNGADLNIDGSMVDTKSTAGMEAYNGYWIIGRNRHNSNINLKAKNLAEYFAGSVTEVNIYSESYNNNYHIHLKMDDDKERNVKDYGTGNNDGIIVGSNYGWFKVTDKISFVKWRGNLVTKNPGMYDAYARIFYDGGPESGVQYTLGRFNIINPIFNCDFEYSFGQGIGYFNEGTQLINGIQISTNYSLESPDKDYEYFMRCSFVSPENSIIDSQINTYTEPFDLLNYNFDMGDAPRGSFMVFDYGFMDGEDPNTQGMFSIPVYIHQMIAPIVNVNTGPFLQAIAPGSMAQPNTVTITTEHFDDLDKITGKYFDKYGNLVVQKDAEQINDTTWTLTQDMGPMPPPGVNLKLEYYLGGNPDPVLIDGPYHITITKTRPPWFDFLADTSFHDVTEQGDSVTFSLSTYFVTNLKHNNRSSFTIPRGVPVMGGTSYANNSPSMEAQLKFIKSQDSLMLGQVPVFRQLVAEYHNGPAYILHTEFKESGTDKYYLDADNNLIATQNKANFIKLTVSLNKFMKNPMTEFIGIYKKLRMNDWQHAKIVGPTFTINFSPTIGWATRLNYKYDTTQRDWGSFGSLEIDANPNHHQAYQNSASYNFVYIGADAEIAGGITFAGGLADIYAGISMGIYIGVGRSFVTIPEFDYLKKTSSELTVSYRVWADMLWGWYEIPIYGPKAIVKVKLAGDDMRNCYPPFDDKQISGFCEADDHCIADSLLVFDPVGWYHKMPLPRPDFSMTETPFGDVVGWLEPGARFGEREICIRKFDRSTKSFSDKMTVISNRNAIHKPEFTMLDEKHVLVTWTQSRHNPESIVETKPEDLMIEMVSSFDVWCAVYNVETQQTELLKQLEDDGSGFTSGRPEGKPKVVSLSNSRAMIVWKVAENNMTTTSLWNVIISRQNNWWVTSEPVAFLDQEGLITQMDLASTGEDQAVLTWNFYDSEEYAFNTLRSAYFDGDLWQNPVELTPEDTTIHYNHLDVNFNQGNGALVYSTVDSDTATEASEKLWLTKWDASSITWNSNSAELLYSSNEKHIQHPCLCVDVNGDAVVWHKLSAPGLKDAEKRLSQTNLIVGNLLEPGNSWETFPANQLVCDTTKEVGALDILNAGGDSLILISHEYLMTATNAPYTPIHGVSFGDDMMNMVLRSVKLTASHEIEDIDEALYFTDVPEPVNYYDVSLEQNAPNPCRNSTSVRFYLATGQHVLLEVFNLNGNKIGTLVNTNLSPGYYKSVISTTSLAPGTYIIQLSSGKTKKSVKMIVSH